MSVKRWKLGWKRCDCVKCEAAITIEQTEENCGWVMWEHHKEEVTRLKAEVERLTKDLADEKSANANVEGRQNSANRGLSMENARLKAEVERLESMADENAHLHKGIYSLSLNVVQLKAEVERLRKAGDELVKHIRHGEEVCYEIIDGDEVIQAWNAAKEGKQP